MLERGTVIEGYRIVGEIGTGSMGLVYLAKQISMERTVAMKVLDPTRAAVSEEHGRMFVNEARGAASLNHPNIVAIHDAGSTLHAGRLLHYFTMEYVDGENLLDLIGRDEVVAGDDLKRIAGGIVAALTYAAGKSIVHRDIKPANIMLTPQREVKLADFGLVSFEDDAFVGKVVGTPRYMSPEQARGLSVDHTADQYGFGCLLYHMLTGEAPYTGANRKEILKQQKHAPIPDPRDMVDCSDAWAELCMQLMAKNPAERFPDPQELADRVQEIIQAPDDGPRQPRRLRPRGRQAGRRGAGRKTRPSRRNAPRESTRREQREAPRRDTRQRGRTGEARGNADRPRRPTRSSGQAASPPTPRPPNAETPRPATRPPEAKRPSQRPPPPPIEELDDSLILGEALDAADAQRDQAEPTGRQRRRESATAPPTGRHRRRRRRDEESADQRSAAADDTAAEAEEHSAAAATTDHGDNDAASAAALPTTRQPDPTDASSLDSSIHEPNRLLLACREYLGTAWGWAKLWASRAAIAGWRATRWLVGRGIAALPVIRRIAYRLVTPSARLTYLISGLTWRIRVVSGRSHLLTAHDAGWTLVAGSLDGRHLPFVWYRLHIEGWKPWRALFSADWWVRYWRHLRGRAQGYLATEHQRSERQRRLLAACRDEDEPLSLSVDRDRRGHLSPSFLAAVSAEGSTVIPLAVASTPGWLFRHNRHHPLIPPPFATIHLAVGEPIHFHDDEDPNATGERLMADLIELQSYLDHLAHVQDPDGLIDQDEEVVEEGGEDQDEEMTGTADNAQTASDERDDATDEEADEAGSGDPADDERTPQADDTAAADDRDRAVHRSGHDARNDHSDAASTPEQSEDDHPATRENAAANEASHPADDDQRPRPD